MLVFDCAKRVQCSLRDSCSCLVMARLSSQRRSHCYIPYFLRYRRASVPHCGKYFSCGDSAADHVFLDHATYPGLSTGQCDWIATRERQQLANLLRVRVPACQNGSKHVEKASPASLTSDMPRASRIASWKAQASEVSPRSIRWHLAFV